MFKNYEVVLEYENGEIEKVREIATSKKDLTKAIVSKYGNGVEILKVTEKEINVDIHSLGLLLLETNLSDEIRNYILAVLSKVC